MKPKKVLLLAVLSGLITTILFFSLMSRAGVDTSASEPEVEMVSVITAAADVPKDQQITEELLAAKEIPADQAHPEMVQDAGTILEQYTVTDIKQGEILMNHRIQNKAEEKEIVSRKIQEGSRGVSIDVTYVTGVSNLIQPEDYVDVVLTSASTGESKVVEEKVRVLAVGGRMTEAKADGTEGEYIAVTLELDQDQTVDLINSKHQGELQLALYSKSDLEKDETDEETGEAAEETEETEETTDENDIEQTEEKDTVITAEVVTIPPKSVIRATAGLEGTPIQVVEEETTLPLLEGQETDEEGRIWLQVETDEQEEGWISSRIIKNKNE
ncbi:Flp pilus assembly protein CpaB [Virgibacillus xinjiangensis]|uniref:Flp pilus assembly protein CpaB n=1 Tax=Virgibacillus xinjiangensis TaxID=393090 RepID=A0ABV7CZM4_9BACI